MILQFRNFIVDDTENHLTIHLEILVNKEISHIANAAPFHFGMSILKLVSEHTSSLANDFNILHNAIITQDVSLEFFFRKVSSMSLKAFYSLRNMLQPHFILNSLFHKAIFYRFQQIDGQKEVGLFQ